MCLYHHHVHSSLLLFFPGLPFPCLSVFLLFVPFLLFVLSLSRSWCVVGTAEESSRETPERASEPKGERSWSRCLEDRRERPTPKAVGRCSKRAGWEDARDATPPVSARLSKSRKRSGTMGQGNQREIEAERRKNEETLKDQRRSRPYIDIDITIDTRVQNILLRRLIYGVRRCR